MDDGDIVVAALPAEPDDLGHVAGSCGCGLVPLVLTGCVRVPRARAVSRHSAFAPCCLLEYHKKRQRTLRAVHYRMSAVKRSTYGLYLAVKGSVKDRGSSSRANCLTRLGFNLRCRRVSNDTWMLVRHRQRLAASRVSLGSACWKVSNSQVRKQPGDTLSFNRPSVPHRELIRDPVTHLS